MVHSAAYDLLNGSRKTKGISFYKFQADIKPKEEASRND